MVHFWMIRSTPHQGTENERKSAGCTVVSACGHEGNKIVVEEFS